MAKRRKLEAPSLADLERIEEEFRGETPPRPNPAAAPIAQVAAEAALASVIISADQRRDQAEAQQFRSAEAAGLLMRELPLSLIDADAIVRDRTVLDAAEMDELKTSIATNGLRLPIEVLPAGADGTHALISGYRRVMAVQDLFKLTGDVKYQRIKTLIRPAAETAETFAAMVEENEIRASLSHFERGRIAVIASQQGAFENTEAAVKVLFSSASKSKRSKVRSFAEIFEMLGDMLAFPEALTEKRGLILASALRQGAEAQLRDALASDQGTSADAEWALLDAVISHLDTPVTVAKKGGRPKIDLTPAGWIGKDTLKLSTGVVLKKERDSQGFVIRITGKPVTAELIDSAMEELRFLFESPKN